MDSSLIFFAKIKAECKLKTIMMQNIHGNKQAF